VRIVRGRPRLFGRWDRRPRQRGPGVLTEWRLAPGRWVAWDISVASYLTLAAH